MEGDLELTSRPRSVSPRHGLHSPLDAKAHLLITSPGFPDFYPSRPAHGQDEDQLTESFIKQGYVSKWGISQAVSPPLAPSPASPAQ